MVPLFLSMHITEYLKTDFHFATFRSWSISFIPSVTFATWSSPPVWNGMSMFWFPAIWRYLSCIYYEILFNIKNIYIYDIFNTYKRKQPRQFKSKTNCCGKDRKKNIYPLLNGKENDINWFLFRISRFNIWATAGHTVLPWSK